MHIDQLETPALLLDLDVLERNLRRMQERADRLGVALRPHIKTHKCVEVARLQASLGARGFTVSTFVEAEALADAGFDDLTWAVPIPPPWIPKAIALAQRITFRVLVDSLDVAHLLARAAREAGIRLHVWLKVDCGYHRAGVDPKSEYAVSLAAFLAGSESLSFDGILTHAGHAYGAASRKEVARIAEQEHSVMLEFARRMHDCGIGIRAISIGSTPTLSAVEDLTGIDEVRPGNYAFYDYTQVALGSCAIDDCALTVLASVISHQPDAGYFVTDAGALALSKDPGPTHLDAQGGWGLLFDDYAARTLHPGLRLGAISQEHGKVVGDDPERLKGRFRVGERVRILEHHSCLTAAQFDLYHVVRGDTVVNRWPVRRAR